jgi:hypothetical protein
MALTLSEELLYTTVKLTCFKNGNPVQTGTGFFWRIDGEGDEHAIMLVTNKHVINGCDRIDAICHLQSASVDNAPSGKVLAVSMTLDPAGIFEHPDPKVDLCAFGFIPLMQEARKAGTPLFLRAIKSSNVPDDVQWTEFDAIEDVLMIGCPNGIYDRVNNHPIVRRGITATSMAKDYNGAAEFLVDMACFPGSSGSPVFIKQRGYVDRKTGNYKIDAHRFFFVGVLYAGPTITNDGVIALGHQPTVKVAAMMHLGQVIRSSKVLDIEGLVRAHLGH